MIHTQLTRKMNRDRQQATMMLQSRRFCKLQAISDTGFLSESHTSINTFLQNHVQLGFSLHPNRVFRRLNLYPSHLDSPHQALRSVIHLWGSRLSHAVSSQEYEGIYYEQCIEALRNAASEFVSISQRRLGSQSEYRIT